MRGTTRKTLVFIALGAALLCTGCASYYSNYAQLDDRDPNDPKSGYDADQGDALKTFVPAGDGLAYYLPRQPIVIEVTVTSSCEATPGGPSKDPDNDPCPAGQEPSPTQGADPTNRIETPSVSSDDNTVPDLRRRFTLSDEVNLIGENSTSFGISPSGLLNTSNSTATSGVGAIAQGLGSAAGAAAAAVAHAATQAAPTLALMSASVEQEGAGKKTTQPQPDNCAVGRTYSIAIWPEEYDEPVQLCKFKIYLDTSAITGLSKLTNDNATAADLVACAQHAKDVDPAKCPVYESHDKCRQEADASRPETGLQRLAAVLANPGAAGQPNAAAAAPRTCWRLKNYQFVWTPSEDNVRLKQYSRAAGIFYRTQLPYLVTVAPADTSRHDSAATSFIAYSSDESPTLFIPVKRTVFAKNVVNIGIKDGIVTSFSQDDSSELAALANLPAEFIQSFATASGSVFSAFATNDSDARSLAVTEAQQRFCNATILANPSKGLTPSQLASAYQSITGVCGTAASPSPTPSPASTTGGSQ